MSAIITFGASVILTVAFLLFKMWENAKGEYYFADTREVIDKKVMHIVAFVYALVLRLPQIFSPRKIIRITTKHTMQWLAKGAKMLERKAHALAMRLSYSDDVNPTKKPSDFLQEVVKHKEQLDKTVPKKIDIEHKK